MAVYSFHLYDRDCTPIFAHHWRRPAHALSPADLDKLVFGVVFSLRSTIRKLAPPALSAGGRVRSFPAPATSHAAGGDGANEAVAGNESGEPKDDRTLPLPTADGYFNYTTAGYSLHAYEPASSLRLVLVTSPSSVTAASLLNPPSAGAPAGAGSFAPLFHIAPALSGSAGGKPGPQSQRGPPGQSISDRVASASGSLLPASLSSSSAAAAAAAARENPLTAAQLGGDARPLNWHAILQQIHHSLYVDYVVRNPFALPELYGLGGLFDDDVSQLPAVDTTAAAAGATGADGEGGEGEGGEMQEVQLDTPHPPQPQTQTHGEPVRDTAIELALQHYASLQGAPSLTAYLGAKRATLRAEMKAARKHQAAGGAAQNAAASGGSAQALQAQAQAPAQAPAQTPTQLPYRYHGDDRLVQNDLFRLALDRFVQSLPAY